MFDVITKLLLHKQIQFKRGEIELFKQSVVMYPADTFVGIQKQLEKFGLENIIYLEGKETGKTWFSTMNKYLKLNRRDIIKWGFNIIALAGWGDPELLKIDSENKEIIFVLKNSSIAKVYGKSQKPVDHYFRGCAAAAGICLFDTDADAIETKCKSQGHDWCEFVTKPKDYWDLDDKFIKSQLLVPTSK